MPLTARVIGSSESSPLNGGSFSIPLAGALAVRNYSSATGDMALSSTGVPVSASSPANYTYYLYPEGGFPGKSAVKAGMCKSGDPLNPSQEAEYSFNLRFFPKPLPKDHSARLTFADAYNAKKEAFKGGEYSRLVEAAAQNGGMTINSPLQRAHNFLLDAGISADMTSAVLMFYTDLIGERELLQYTPAGDNLPFLSRIFPLLDCRIFNGFSDGTVWYIGLGKRGRGVKGIIERARSEAPSSARPAPQSPEPIDLYSLQESPWEGFPSPQYPRGVEEAPAGHTPRPAMNLTQVITDRVVADMEREEDPHRLRGRRQLPNPDNTAPGR